MLTYTEKIERLRARLKQEQEPRHKREQLPPSANWSRYRQVRRSSWERSVSAFVASQFRVRTTAAACADAANFYSPAFFADPQRIDVLPTPTNEAAAQVWQEVRHFLLFVAHQPTPTDYTSALVAQLEITKRALKLQGALQFVRE